MRIVASGPDRKVHKRTSLEDRLMRKIERIPEAGCWLFMGAVNERGYGCIGTGSHPRLEPTHRTAYRLFVGPIPDGLFVCHRCDVPNCCNPHHLFVGTPLDNARDMVAKGRNKSDPDAYPGTGVDLRDHRLTSMDKTQIKALRLVGESIQSLAKQFDTTQLVISDICRFHTPLAV